MIVEQILERAEAKDPTLTVIDLSDVKICTEDMKKLVSVLPLCSALKQLIFRRSSLGVEGVRILASALPSCKTLTKLELWNNGIGAEGVKELASVLPSCSALSTLDLNREDLGVEGVKALASVLPFCISLSTLDLEGNNLEVEGAKALVSVLPQCKMLSELRLNSNDIRVEGAKALSSVLPYCSNLTSLALENNKLEAKATKALASVLSSCSNLSRLDFAFNQPGIEGMQALVTVLPSCITLSSLNLSYDNLGTEGARILASVLSQCSSLAYLNLSDNNLGVEGAKIIASVLPSCALRNIYLARNIMYKQKTEKIREYNKRYEEYNKIEQAIESILIVNRQRYEVLMEAIAQGDLAKVKAIQGVSLHAMIDNHELIYFGYTPLLFAVSQGKHAIVEWLLEKGCYDGQKARETNAVLPEDRGKSALEIAQTRGFKEIVSLLQKGNSSQVKKEARITTYDESKSEIEREKSSFPVQSEVKMPVNSLFTNSDVGSSSSSACSNYQQAAETNQSLSRSSKKRK